ncbi:MarR family winged helix-turn-helix transcriptional regulator [Geodermatophilus sp. DSM 44513]|uniref:MarR family winged helix-turn-helix transcriptional regulator n=1 Tax=Geodermatophilus sp. DSM 44513 TaxID=1528104 RepID=UPI0012822FAB|nr:MarR family winged helix-turn-helix transcriptional regulator [Geodermatophilus sp. DSM 44513]WNV77806.1 MarR family winged helix-turn-helix transcriptional regulator [Geodermatophilus sp. DSM 44513]
MRIDPPVADPTPTAAAGRGAARPGRSRPWTLLTHHAQMLLAVARQPDARIPDLAAVIGVTPRAALTLLQDLEDAGHLHRTRVGRRNRYTVHPESAVLGTGHGVRSVRQFLAAFGTVTADTVDTA